MINILSELGFIGLLGFMGKKDLIFYYIILLILFIS